MRVGRVGAVDSSLLEYRVISKFWLALVAEYIREVIKEDMGCKKKTRARNSNLSPGGAKKAGSQKNLVVR
jgi:hypothetical protein